MCNPLKKDCPDIDNPIYSEAYSNIYYINSFIDFSNYNKPINYYLDNYVQLFSKDYLKRIYINLSKNIISIDNGWIFSLEKEFNFVSVSSIKTDISSISKTSPLDVLWIDFNSPNIFHKYRRRYLTIQNLFAQLGGIANSLFVFSQILISIFVKFKYYSFLDFEIKKMTKSNKLISKEKLELNLINNISSIIKNKIFENEDLSKVNINSKNIINQYIEIFDKKDPIEENEDNSKLKNDINKDINKNPLSLRSNNCALNNEINLPIKKIKTKIDLKRNDSSKIIKDEKQIEKSFFEYLLSFFNNKYREKFKVDFEFIEKTLDIINFINNFQLSNSSAI